MKTIEEVQIKNDICDVLTLEDFRNYVDNGFFTDYDGVGYLHNGNKETSISVWDINLFNAKYDKYPYVCWYNK